MTSRSIFFAVAALAGTALCSPAIAQDQTLLERGTYLMHGPVACGNCHTPLTPEGTFIDEQELSGRFVIEEPGLKAFAPNITQHMEDGIGAWTDVQIVKAIREGVRPDGTIIGPPMPIVLYRQMSDADAAAIVAYLRNVPPVPGTQPKSEYAFPLPPSYGPPVENVTAPSPDDQLAHGEYMVAIAHCLECHTTPGEGGAPDYENRLGAGGFEFNGPWGVSISANLTSHPEDGIVEWSDADLKQMITTGKRPDGTPMLPPMGYSFYANISDADLDAIIAYLRTLPPLPDADG